MFLKSPKVLLFLIPLLLLVACGGNSISFDDSGVTVNISLSEEMIQTMFSDGNVRVDEEDLFTEVTGVDFSEGIITVQGLYQTPSGSEAEGFVDLSFSALNEFLRVEIVDHNLDGLSDKIDEANRELAKAFAAEAAQEDNVRFTQVSVSDDSLDMEIQVSFE